MVQSLGFEAFPAMAVKAVQTPARELRSCKPCVCLPAKSLQPCLTLCDPLDCSPPASSVCGIFQARVLEWVAMLSSRGSSQPRDGTQVSYASCIADWFFTTSATWEAPCKPQTLAKKKKKDFLVT